MTMQGPPQRRTWYLPYGQRLEDAVGFLAYGIIIDNPTDQWLQVYGPDYLVPPCVVGVQLPIHQGTQVADVRPIIVPGVDSFALPTYGTASDFAQPNMLASEQQNNFDAGQRSLGRVVGQSVRVTYIETSINAPFSGVNARVSLDTVLLDHRLDAGNPFNDLWILPNRAVYGLDIQVYEPDSGERIIFTAYLPGTIGGTELNWIFHECFYTFGVGAAGTSLMNPSRIIVPEYFPPGTAFNVVAVSGAFIDRATTPGEILGSLSADVFIQAYDFGSRAPRVQGHTRSAHRAIPIVVGGITYTIQSHQFSSVSIGMHNPGTALIAFSIEDAESGRVIASGNVPIGGDDTVILTEELPDAITLVLGTATVAAGVLTVKGNCA